MVGVDLEIDEKKLWDPAQSQAYMDTLPDMKLFEDHIVEGDEMVEAIQALVEDGESAQSLALHWKNQGNDMFSDAKRLIGVTLRMLLNTIKMRFRKLQGAGAINGRAGPSI
ncbi:hypothetical protein PsorP6_014839 [Peronosclerospora sorghi]|uniref:Uncharacterized protein n=1 Tax=Peronosclerospora sorghi TaxID=230839 RepID=A0ACC0VS58_9STRA|nr:hypothetical protein PsorP6_014839 [Peronosclerospora sorghi]